MNHLTTSLQIKIRTALGDKQTATLNIGLPEFTNESKRKKGKRFIPIYSLSRLADEARETARGYTTAYLSGNNA